jgi:plastocyanin
MNRLYVLLIVCVAAAFGLAACGSDNNDNSSATTTGATGTTGTSGASGSTGASGASGSTGASGGGGGKTITVDADPSGQLKFKQSSLSAPAGKDTFEFVNDSPVPHDLTIEASGNKELGKTPTITKDKKKLTVTLKPGKYTYFCSVDGHEQAGMKGTLTVK